MEKTVDRNTDDGINSLIIARLPLNQFWDDYIGTKYELKQSNRMNYKQGPV
jgi:hypothetical protein